MIGLLLGSAIYMVALAKWTGAFIVVGLAVTGFRRLGIRSLIVAGCAIVMAIWLAMSTPPVIQDPLGTDDSSQMVVASMPRQRSNGWDFEARMSAGNNAGARFLVHSTDPTPPPLGATVYLRGDIIPADRTGGQFDYLRGLGASGEIFTSEVIVDSIHDSPSLIDRFRRIRSDVNLQVVRGIQLAVPGDTGALLAGFVTGDDGRLSDDADDAFRAAGLSHLTAVSGSNLAMLLTLIGIVHNAYRFDRRVFIFSGVALLWTYALFVGLPPPTLRAALLGSLAAGGRLLGRPIDLLGLTLLASAIQLAVAPSHAWSISFHLSVAASIALAIGMSRYPGSALRSSSGELLSATVYAQVATLPLVVGVFGTAPLTGVLANIVAIPFATIAFAIGLLGSIALFIWEPLGIAMLIPAGWSADVVLRIAELFGDRRTILDVRTLGDFWIILGTLAVLGLLFAASGELGAIRRNLARNRIKPAEHA